MATLTITLTVPGPTASAHKASATDLLQAVAPPLKDLVSRSLGQTSNVPADSVKVSSVTFS